MAGVKLNGINKVYSNGAHAVRGVDMDITDGEFMISSGQAAAENRHTYA